MGGVLIDANVLIDVSDPDAEHHAWSTQRVAEAISGHHAMVNPLIYAEVSGRYSDPAELEKFLDPTEIRRDDLPYSAAWPAMRTFRTYREAGGTRTSCLSDFYIGAHAEVDGHALLTRDVRRFRTYFPSVQLITPGGG